MNNDIKKGILIGFSLGSLAFIPYAIGMREKWYMMGVDKGTKVTAALYGTAIEIALRKKLY